jgi:hypothetical protein
VHPQHLDRLPVQLRQHVGLHDLVGSAGGDLAAGHVDDPVHHRQQRVHVVRGQQDGYLLTPGQVRQQRDDVVTAGDVKVGERLVEQQQLRLADQRMRDHDALLLAAGQLTDPRAGVSVGPDGLEHVLYPLAPLPGRKRQAELVAVDTQRDDIRHPQRHVRVDQQLLRDIADGGVLCDRAFCDVLEAEDDAEQGGLAGAVRTDQAGELALSDVERDVLQDRPAAEADRYVVQAY